MASFAAMTVVAGILLGRLLRQLPGEPRTKVPARTDG
jgi:hypothetical protein